MARPRYDKTLDEVTTEAKLEAPERAAEIDAMSDFIKQALGQHGVTEIVFADDVDESD